MSGIADNHVNFMIRDFVQSNKNSPRYLQTRITRFLTILKEKGLVHVVVFLFNHFFAYPIFLYYRTFEPKNLNFNGTDIPYFFHPHNHTWLNERVIEIPVIFRLVQPYRQKNKRILEVGNVLSHYFPIQHEVIDKYEVAKGVINQDVTEFHPSHRYDLIISISTLEHVGWDEIPKQPEKIFEAISQLKSLLKKDGEIYITLPIGENPFLDSYLREGKLQFDQQYNFIRVAKTEWQQTEWSNIAFAQHNKPFRFGNALIIGYIQG